MATAAVLTERAESLGLPITKNAFEGTLENPVPPLPYMVYLLPREATAGADSRNFTPLQMMKRRKKSEHGLKTRFYMMWTMLNLWLMWIVRNVFKRPTKSRDY